ncbi:MAG: serine/threonine-protein kinase [Myxococcota bacterium]
MAFFPQPKYQKFGKYILLDRINVGGMAEVFRGKQFGVEGFARLVALKRILPNIAKDEEFIEMFVDEAKLAVQLQHANIAQTLDLGNVDGRYYISMEYVSGTDLRTIWDRARRRNRLLPIAMSCYLVMKACEGLDYAHRKKDEVGKEIGLVHRDVSPQNILVSFEGEVKVVDFGIALARHKVSKTQAGVLKGKFGYMSPEQVRGAELDHRSDIFAAGIMLWEMLVGDRLFLGESDFSTLEKVRNVEMVPPTHFNKNLAPQVERVVMKALAKSRDDRYRYASEMAEDLQRYLFASNQPFARTDLSRYMHQHFADEMKQEQERLERYRDIAESDFDGEVVPNVQGLNPNDIPTGAQISAREMTPSKTGVTEVGQPIADLRVPSALKANPMSFDGLSPARPSQPAPPLRPSMPAGNYAVPSVPTPAPHGLPTWAKALIGVLSSLVVIGAGVGIWFAFLAGPALGTIHIEVQPREAEVYLNEQKVGNGDFTKDLDPGTYVVAAKKAGMRDLVRSVKVIEKQVTSETFVLEPIAGTASAFIRVQPQGLAVWLDGADTGKKTPTTLTQLMAGQHELVLKQGEDVVYRAPLNLTDAAAEVVEVDLSSLPAVLEVSASTGGTEVLVDGKKLGAAPLRVDNLQPGPVQVTVKKARCESYTEKVELKRGVTRKISASLKCP